MMKIQFTKGQIERLLETYNVNNIENILKEDVRSSVIARLLGKRLVTKLESTYGDDAVKVLDNLFSAAESRSGNIITGLDKKLYIVSSTGKKWSMEEIKQVINGVASGNIPANSLDRLPKTLKDGTNFRSVFQNQFKYGKPKTAPTPKTTTPTTPTPKTTPTPNIVGGSLTDDVIIGNLRDTFKELNIPYRLTSKQEKFFIAELRSLVNAAYQQIRKELPEDFETAALRFKSLPPTKQKEVIIEAQKKIRQSSIGLGTASKQIKQFNESLDKLLEGLRVFKGDSFKDKLYNFVIFNVGLTMTDMLINSIVKGKLTSENVFGLSWKQQIIYKGFTSAVLAPYNIGKKLNIIYTVIMAAVALGSEDKSEQLGDFPISINDAKEYVEGSSNPLEREKDDSGKYIELVTKYEPVDKNLKPMGGDKGAFIKIYINNEYFGALQKDITGKIKIK
jgi:hypothetical protein